MPFYIDNTILPCKTYVMFLWKHHRWLLSIYEETLRNISGTLFTQPGHALQAQNISGGNFLHFKIQHYLIFSMAIFTWTSHLRQSQKISGSIVSPFLNTTFHNIFRTILIRPSCLCQSWKSAGSTKSLNWRSKISCQCITW